jgi:uncharacterized protein YcgL (UPF0745 family)
MGTSHQRNKKQGTLLQLARPENKLLEESSEIEVQEQSSLLAENCGV